MKQAEFNYTSVKPRISKVGNIMELVAEVDLIYAIAFVYFCHGRKVCSGKSFKTWLAEEREFGRPGLLPRKFSRYPVDYPEHIRGLGWYLLNCYENKRPIPWALKD
jgi:hypothetical protein